MSSFFVGRSDFGMKPGTPSFLFASVFVRGEPSIHAAAVTGQPPFDRGLRSSEFASEPRHQPDRGDSLRACVLPVMELSSHAFTSSWEQPFNGGLGSVVLPSSLPSHVITSSEANATSVVRGGFIAAGLSRPTNRLSGPDKRRD